VRARRIVGGNDRLAERDEAIGTRQIADRACAARAIRIKGGIGGIGEGSHDEGLSRGRRGKTPEGKAASHYQYRDETDSYSVRVHNLPPY